MLSNSSREVILLRRESAATLDFHIHQGETLGAPRRVQLAIRVPGYLMASIGMGARNALKALSSPGEDGPMQSDIGIMAFWEQASNEERTIATLGSHSYYGAVISRPNDHSAIVQITASNEMTLGSLLSPIRETANQIAGSDGPFSPVQTVFSWTETLTW